MAWRDHPYTYRGMLYIDRPETVFAARVNQSSFTYPIVECEFDTVTTGAFGDIEIGMTVLFGTSAGASDLGRQRIRKVADSNTIFFGESSENVHDGEVDLQNNAYITVLNDRRVWVIPPRFDDDAVHYKDYDITYTEGGRNYQERPGPVANGGPWRVALFDAGQSYATFEFDGTDSFGVTAGATTIVTYLWDVQDGTITVGNTGTSSITATFPAGRRYVTLTVTDGNGDTHTTYILVVVLGVDEATWKPIRDFDVIEHRKTRDGTFMGFMVHEDIAPSTYYDGVAVLYFEEEYYNGVKGSLAGPSTVEQVKFVGWHDSNRESSIPTFRGRETGVMFNCISSLERMKQVNLLPMLVEDADSPASWVEMKSLTVGRFLFYLARWHSTLFEVCPVIRVTNNLNRAYAGLRSDANTLYAMIKDYIASTGNVWTCDQRGIFRVMANPLWEATGDRVATVIATIDGDDYGTVDIEKRNFLDVYWMDTSGIVLGKNALTVYSRAPGLAPGQGPTRASMSEQLVSDQDELNARTGNEYARRNNRWLPIKLQMVHTGDIGCDPALYTWVTLTVAAASNRRGLSLTSQRTLPTQVNITHSNDRRGTKNVEWVVEVETDGTPGATLNLSENPDPPPPPPDEEFPEPPIPEPDKLYLFKGIKDIAAINSDGYVYVTNNFDVRADAGGPDWTRVNLSLSGTPVSFSVDPFSDLYFVDGGDDEVDGWVVTTTNIYYVEDLFSVNGPPTVTNQHTFANAVPSDGSRTVMASFGNFNSGVAWVGVLSYYKDTGGHTGTWYINSIDGGATWGSEVQITSHYWTSAGGNNPPLYLSPKTNNLIYAAAFTNTATPATLDGYKSTNGGAAWVALTDPDILPLGQMGRGLHVPWPSNASELIVYHCAVDKSVGTDLKTKRVNSTSIADITPTDASAREYGPFWDQFAIRTFDRDRRHVVMAGEASGSFRAAFVSDDFGDNWTRIVDAIAAANPAPRGVAFAGDTQTVIYLWGFLGYLSYTQDSGDLVEDKRGNIPDDFPSIGTILGIAGG